MKYLTLFFVISCVVFTSCKKEFTCRCHDTTIPSANGKSEETIKTSSEKKAKAECESTYNDPDISCGIQGVKR